MDVAQGTPGKPSEPGPEAVEAVLKSRSWEARLAEARARRDKALAGMPRGAGAGPGAGPRPWEKQAAASAGQGPDKSGLPTEEMLASLPPERRRAIEVRMSRAAAEAGAGAAAGPLPNAAAEGDFPEGAKEQVVAPVMGPENGVVADPSPAGSAGLMPGGQGVGPVRGAFSAAERVGIAAEAGADAMTRAIRALSKADPAAVAAPPAAVPEAELDGVVVRLPRRAAPEPVAPVGSAVAGSLSAPSGTAGDPPTAGRAVPEVASRPALATADMLGDGAEAILGLSARTLYDAASVPAPSAVPSGGFRITPVSVVLGFAMGLGLGLGLTLAARLVPALLPGRPVAEVAVPPEVSRPAVAAPAGAGPVGQVAIPAGLAFGPEVAGRDDVLLAPPHAEGVHATVPFAAVLAPAAVFPDPAPVAPDPAPPIRGRGPSASVSVRVLAPLPGTAVADGGDGPLAVAMPLLAPEAAPAGRAGPAPAVLPRAPDSTPAAAGPVPQRPDVGAAPSTLSSAESGAVSPVSGSALAGVEDVAAWFGGPSTLHDALPAPVARSVEPDLASAVAQPLPLPAFAGVTLRLMAPEGLADVEERAIAGRLAAAGFAAPERRVADFTIKGDQVRFYAEADREAAVTAALALNAKLRDFSGSGASMPKGVIEVWLKNAGPKAAGAKPAPTAKKPARAKAGKIARPIPVPDPLAQALRDQIIAKLRARQP